MEPLQAYLKASAVGDLLPWQAQRDAATAFRISLAQVEESALDLGLLPARYQRNRSSISIAGQLKLLRSRVVVIGCGGLGGYVIEQLARLGVGQIVAVDPDIFEEHNLNRQLLATPASLGRPKAGAAAERVQLINPMVRIVPVQAAFGEDNGTALLEGASLVVDALDNIAVRLQLSEICRQMAIPLVHGAIGGWFGHVATQYPGERTIEFIYRNWSTGKGIEQRWGNPAFTPAVIASLQVAEACKVLTGQGEPLRKRELAVDLYSMEFHTVPVE